MEQKEKQNTFFTQQEIEQHLQSALAAATPDVWSRLDLSVPQDPPAGGAVKEKRRAVMPGRRFGSLCAAACVCLVLLGGYYHYEYVQVVAEVGIDVNPSLQLSLNRKDRVVCATALNEDGRSLLADTDLKGSTVAEAADQVVSSLLDQGYLRTDTQENTVLVSVSGDDQEKTEALKEEVSSDVEKVLAEKQVSAVVYSQTIEVTGELQQLAETYQVSPGKAEFVGQLVIENEALCADTQSAYEQMMGQTMEELTQEIRTKEYSVSSGVTIIRTAQTADTAEKQLADRDDRDEPAPAQPDAPEPQEKPDADAAKQPEETADAEAAKRSGETADAEAAKRSEETADAGAAKQSEETADAGVGEKSAETISAKEKEAVESVSAREPEETGAAAAKAVEKTVSAQEPEETGAAAEEEAAETGAAAVEPEETETAAVEENGAAVTVETGEAGAAEKEAKETSAAGETVAFAQEPEETGAAATEEIEETSAVAEEETGAAATEEIEETSAVAEEETEETSAAVEMRPEVTGEDAAEQEKTESSEAEAEDEEERMPFVFGPGNVVRYSRSGLQITKNGTKIIYEPEEEEKKVGYASEYLSEKARALIHEGPGIGSDD